MKKQTFIIVLMIVSLGVSSSLFAQEKLGNNTQKITVTFKNNSLLVRKYSFITYVPNETGNSTTADFMWPYATKAFNSAGDEVLFGFSKRSKSSHER